MTAPFYRTRSQSLVPIYLLFKGDEGLRRNDVIVKIAGYAGKDAKYRDAA